MNTETVARVLAALRKNDGVLTVKSANEEGISKSTLLRAAEDGVAVKRTARNRYSSPSVPPRQLAYRGAYLGRDAVLSVEGAAYYWGFDCVDHLTLRWSIPHGARATSPNVIRRRNFSQLELVERDGVVVTSPAQTLLDLGARVDIDTLECMYESALRLGLVDDVDMRAWLAERKWWHGAPALREVQSRRRSGQRPTGSEPETRFVQLLRRHGIHAERQWRIDATDGTLIGYADVCLPPKACVFEVDGLEAHDLANRQYDYYRQGRIEDHGYLVRRLTVEDVKYRGTYVLQRVRNAMAIAPPLPSDAFAAQDWWRTR